MKKIILVFICVLAYTFTYAQSPLNVNGWRANSDVLAIAEDATHLYLGGGFSKFFKDGVAGVRDSRGAAFDLTTGSDDVIQGFPNVNGRVEVCISDDNGGWFIGGQFTQVGGVARNNIARILSDKTLDPNWNPNANFEVRALLLHNNLLYVGGSFTNIGGQARNRIARLNTTTGAADTWNPNSSGNVFSLQISFDNKVYVGGDFTNIGGQARNSIARFDITTGAIDTWNPNANATSSIFTMLVTGDDLYVGGAFFNIGGQNRNNIARLSTSTANADSWNPNANERVRTLLLTSSGLFVGGRFSNIGGQARNRIARLNTTTGAADTWNAGIGGTALSVEVRTVYDDMGNLYIGGSFALIAGQDRRNLALVSRFTGDLLSWNPDPNNNAVSAMTQSNSTLYVGGDFTQIGGVRKANLARIQKSNNELDLSWGVSVNDRVWALAVSGTDLYIGGVFNEINGQTRRGIARITTTGTGSLSTWNPNPAAGTRVRTLLVFGNDIYVGGFFGDMGSTTRSNIARLTASSNIADSWNPGANGEVYTLALSGNNLYVGGSFSTLGGQTRNRLGRVSTTTGAVDTWQASIDDVPSTIVRTLLVSGNDVYVGGTFGLIGGAFRNNLARLSTSTANADTWNPDTNGGVSALALSGNSLYVGGSFGIVGGQTRNRIARVSTTGTGAVDSWNPNINNEVVVLLIANNDLYTGGFFGTVNGENVRGFAILPTTPSISVSNTPTAGFNTTYGTPSDAGTFNVSGTLLSAGITITAPAGFQVSSLPTSGYANSLTINAVAGTVNNAEVFIRLAANAPAGNYNGLSVQITSSGASTVTFVLPNSAVNAKEISVSGLTANSKVFDGATTATLSGAASLDGVITGDNVSLSGTPTVNFDTPEAGTNKNVLVTGYTLSGTSANNYTVVPFLLVADITPKALTISGLTANNKEFDGTTTATLSGTPSLVGVVTGFEVTLSGTPIANFDTPNIGTNKQVSVTGFSLTGSASANYTLTLPLLLTANITEIGDPTSLLDFNQNNVIVYPNPTASKIFIRLPSTTEDLIIRVLDNQGRVLKAYKQIDFGRDVVEISLENQSEGVYWVEISQKDKVFTKRIVKL